MGILTAAARAAARILRVVSRLIGKRQRRTGSDDKPFLSIVLLLREFHDLPESVLTLAAERAWNADFHTEGSGNYVVKNQVIFLVQFSGLFLSLINSPRPYSDEPEREAEKIPEARRRKAWAEHRAWISIDHNYSGTLSAADEDEKLAKMGRLAAELLNNNCTAVYLPATNYLIPNDEFLRERLSTFQSLQDLYSADTKPVPVVEEDDPRLAEVVARAKAEWPKFVKAFQERAPDDQFLVKALFSDGENGEWMWFEVASMFDGKLLGPLHNSPVSVRTVAQGDEVEIRETEIGDWFYVQNGDEHGGFSRALFE